MTSGTPTGFEMQDAAKERLHESLRRDLGGVVLGALNDPKVIEVMLNPDGRVWIEDFTKGMVDSGYQMPGSQALKLFATIASMLNTVVNAASPILEGELPLDMLKHVREFVAGYEVQDCPLWQWEEAILQGYAAFRFLQLHRRGRITVDLANRRLSIEELPA